MNRRIAPILSGILTAALLAGATVSVHAQPSDEQEQARKDMRAGNVQSLRQIEQKVLPQMKGMQYLGPEYDSAAMAYRLKFIKDGRVVFIDVDARSGRIISRSK